MRKQLLILLALGAALGACAKPKLHVLPCDQDLGYADRKMHLSNVKYLDENRAADWFEIYLNLDDRRKNQPAENCIPTSAPRSIEQEIDRTEHDVRNLR